MEDDQLIWHRYLAVDTGVKATTTLEKRDVLTRPASLISSAATTSVETPAGRSLASLVMPSNKGN